jgi:N-acetylneuraminic acid mutarotase
MSDAASFALGSDSWEDLVRMPVKRAGGAVAAIGNSAYLFCGELTTVTVGQVDVFDRTGKTWAKATEMPTPRQGCGAAAVNGRIFVIGGGRMPGLSVSNLNEVYVP